MLVCGTDDGAIPSYVKSGCRNNIANLWFSKKLQGDSSMYVGNLFSKISIQSGCEPWLWNSGSALSLCSWTTYLLEMVVLFMCYCMCEIHLQTDYVKNCTIVPVCSQVTHSQEIVILFFMCVGL